MRPYAETVSALSSRSAHIAQCNLECCSSVVNCSMTLTCHCSKIGHNESLEYCWPDTSNLFQAMLVLAHQSFSLPHIFTPSHACSNSSPSVRNVINVDCMGRSITASTVQLGKSQRRVWLESKGHSLHGWDLLGRVPSLVLGIRCTWMTRSSSMHHQAGKSGSSPVFWCPTHVCLWQPQLGIQSVHTQSRLCCHSPHQRP